MNKTATGLDGVFILEPRMFQDNRGYFMESYNQRAMKELGFDFDFIQDNQSLSRETGVIRGLHYQLSKSAQTKLVRCLKGAIFDVAVDIRKNSPTFGKWVGVELTAQNQKQLLVPKGFAHGFCTLEPDTVVAYKVDAFYSPAHDRGIRFDDPVIGIDWPVKTPVLSDKDGRLPFLATAENDF